MHIGCKAKFEGRVLNSTMSAVPKLLAVTLIRSGIGKPYWQKRTLRALGLVKMHKIIIHKNSPSVTGMLSSVKELIQVRPVSFRNDLENSPNKGAFFLDNGEVFVDPQTIPSRVTRAEPQRTDGGSVGSSSSEECDRT